MERCVFLLILTLWGHSVAAQTASMSVQLVDVKAGNNQKDSSFVTIRLPAKGPVRLAYNKNYLIFSFINTKQPTAKAFRYKLTGLDYAWITCTGCSQALYAHLDGGEYTFEVKTAEANAVPTTFSFTIEGNSWHQWWFVPMLFLYFLVLLGVGIYFFILYNFRQKLREQRAIHKEKMASMAELTAGIAHEIQNPLNFVNNFSEVSAELIVELKEGPLTHLPHSEKDYADEILTDITQNLERIGQYGHRASNIVRGMVEHSRFNTGEHQPTDLNALVQEYLRLAYHGWQRSESRGSSDKTVSPGAPDRDQFTCVLETNLDPKLPVISVVQQDLSRVLQNIYSNAFYTVRQKQKTASADYKATVTVSTTHANGRIIIRVRDNGMGIPENIRGKIFQPFFTTKPTGEGTGLGLSLSYDIVTKGHGGKLSVESQEGAFTEFVITLPASVL